MNLLYPWLQRRVQVSNFQKLLNYHYENVDTKLTLTLLNQLYIGVENVKDGGATFVHLLWIAKQLTSARNAMSHVLSITNKPQFYASIVRYCISN